MKRPTKVTFYLGLMLIVCFFVFSVTGLSITDESGQKKTYIRGIGDINWGTDVLGGVSVTFAANGRTNEHLMLQLRDCMNKRLSSIGLTDQELYIDSSNNSLLVSFPWIQNEDGDAVETIDYLSKPGRFLLVAGRPFNISSFHSTRKGDYVYDSRGNSFPIIMEGNYVEKTTLGYDDMGNRTLTVQFNEDGKLLLADATARQQDDFITVWLDDRLISTMAISSVNISGEILIGRSGGLDDETANEIIRYIETGALPVNVYSRDYEISDPAFNENTIRLIIVTAVAAFVLVWLFLIVRYRLPGFIAGVTLIGQTAGLIAATSGFFPFFDGVTLTIPGVAGMMVSIGMGVDANIIKAERIKDEIEKGKSLSGAIDYGSRTSFTSVFNSNITILIVAFILMGVFGPPDNICNIILTPIMWKFPRATTGSIYAFGYIMLFGVLFNFVMGVLLSRVMLLSVSQHKRLCRRWLYGGEREE